MASKPHALDLSSAERVDLKTLTKTLQKLSQNEVEFEDVFDFLRDTPQQGGKETQSKAEQELAQLVLRQRMKQLVHKYLASATIKQGRIEYLRGVVNDLETQQKEMQNLIQQKQTAIENVATLQQQLESAVSKAQQSLQNDTSHVENEMQKAQALVAEKQQAVDQAMLRLEAARATATEHQRTLEQQRNLLQAISQEQPLKDEIAEHQALLDELEAELARDMAQGQEELDQIKKHFEQTAEQTIQQKVNSAFAEDLAQVAKEDLEIKERIFCEALALKTAREKLSLLQFQSNTKDFDIDRAIHEFDIQVKETVFPLREEVEKLRNEIFNANIHANRKVELEEELGMLEKELEALVQETEARKVQMSETQMEYDNMLQQVRDEKQQKLDRVSETFNQFKEEVREKEATISLGLKEQNGIERQAQLKHDQVANLYERIERLETGLKLKSAEMELLQREIANTNDSARVHSEEVFMAETLQKMAEQESSMKQELRQCLEEKLAIVKKLRANVEAQQMTVKDHARNSDAGKRAMQSIKDVDDKRLKLLNGELELKGDQIANLKKLLKGLRDEVTALEKVKTSCEKYQKAAQTHLTHLNEQIAWFNDHSAKMSSEQPTKDNALIPRLQYAAKAAEQRARDLKAMGYVVEDRHKATQWHAEVLASRQRALQKTVDALEKERSIANEKISLVRSELEQARAEIEVEQTKIAMLQRDIASFQERSHLLEQATTNSENELRLHKLTSNVWQKKIKIVRDEIKVREMRNGVVQEEVLRLEDLRRVRGETLGMLTALNENLAKAISMTEEEITCLQAQEEVIKTKAQIRQE